MRKQFYFCKAKIEKWEKMLAGMESRWRNPDIRCAALLVIDMQRYFLDKSSHAYVPSATAIAPNVQRLIRLFRKNKRPVAFTRFAIADGENDPVGTWWGRSVSDSSFDGMMAKNVQPEKGEKVFRKSSYSPFRGTDLERHLRKLGARQVVIAGVLTNLCCETAAREAFELGFDVFLVADATATYSEKMHEATLLNLSFGFATPVRASDLRPLRPMP